MNGYLLTDNRTDTKWFFRALKTASIFCLTHGRISFYDVHGEGGSPTNGQAFFYFGEQVKAFRDEFHDVGPVVTEFPG